MKHNIYLRDPDILPVYSEEGYSQDVFIIDENGLHGIGYYHYDEGKWYFHTDTLVDYNEEGNETKWKWYYPPITVEEAF